MISQSEETVTFTEGKLRRQAAQLEELDRQLDALAAEEQFLQAELKIAKEAQRKRAEDEL